jgi:hypothetical protein
MKVIYCLTYHLMSPGGSSLVRKGRANLDDFDYRENRLDASTSTQNGKGLTPLGM